MDYISNEGEESVEDEQDELIGSKLSEDIADKKSQNDK